MYPLRLRKTRQIALISILSVLYTVLRLVPAFPMIGVSATFSASDIIAPLYGILFGPLVGGLSIALGTFLAILFGKPMVFLGLDFLPAMINAVLLGLIVSRRWSYSVIIYLALLTLFILHPYTKLFVEVGIPNTDYTLGIPLFWMHLVGLLLLLSPLSKRAAKSLWSGTSTSLLGGVLVLALIGTLGQHLMGGLLYETILGNYLQVIKPEAFDLNWRIIFWIYPFERTIFALLATAVGSPVIRILRKSGTLVASRDEALEASSLE